MNEDWWAEQPERRAKWVAYFWAPALLGFPAGWFVLAALFYDALGWLALSLPFAAASGEVSRRSARYFGLTRERQKRLALAGAAMTYVWGILLGAVLLGAAPNS